MDNAFYHTQRTSDEKCGFVKQKLVYVFLDRTTPDSSQEKTKPGMVTAGGAAPQQRDALCLLAERNAGERAEAEKAFDQMKVEERQPGPARRRQLVRCRFLWAGSG